MSADRWNQIDAIFQSLLEQPPEHRAAYLDEVCSGDESLRQEIEAYISYDEQTWSLLDSPAFEVAAPILSQTRAILDKGQHLTHYEILDLIGAGGMGEVYLAQDTILGRKVALKLLPENFTRSDLLVERFRQEARTLSALNHPNILTIHEIAQDADHHFIATEFIEGETLRRRMQRGRLSLNEALDIAIQVAGALAAAHQAGIIHRDIKPENIMLRTDGYVKVLDFGLAKLAEQEAPERVEENEDVTAKHSSGLLMGTLRYMSPEQARREQVDARTDIFSFGVVIYEMVAGNPPFEGETNSDLIAEILRVEPPPLARYAPDTPVELQRIVSKALEKEMPRRYQSARDLLVDLKRLGHGIEAMLKYDLRPDSSENAEPEGASGKFSIQKNDDQATRIVASGTLTSLRLIKHHRIGVMVTALLLTAVAAIVYGIYKFRGSSRSSMPFQSTHISKLTSSGKARDAAISPDGKYVAYVVNDAGQQSLWVLQLDMNNSTQVVPPTGVRYAALTFSPDNQSIYFVKYEKHPSPDKNGLYQVSVLGGDLKKVIGNVHSTISFSPDGQRFAFFRHDKEEGGNALMIANADGTGEEELARRVMPERFADYPGGPAWSPDGQVIACGTIHTQAYTRPIDASLSAIRVDDHSEKIIVTNLPPGVFGVGWLADQSAMILSAMEAGESPDTTHILHVAYPTGVLRSIRNDLTAYLGLSLTADARALIVTALDYTNNIWVGSGEHLSQVKQITFGAGLHPGLSWTPDGRIVYAEQGDSPSDKWISNLWIMERDGSGQKQLTFATQADVGPSVSADGRYIVFIDQKDFSRVMRVDIDGSNIKQLTDGREQEGICGPQCSPDSKWVVYQAGESIWKVSIDGGTPIQLTGRASSDRFGWGPAISPDGKFIAYYAKGDYIEVMPFDGGQPAMKFLIGRHDDVGGLQWALDGRAIDYVIDFGGASNIWTQPLNGGPPKRLTDFRSERISGYSWSQDGKKIAFIRGQMTNDILMIETAK